MQAIEASASLGSGAEDWGLIRRGRPAAPSRPKHGRDDYVGAALAVDLCEKEFARAAAEFEGLARECSDRRVEKGQVLRIIECDQRNVVRDHQSERFQRGEHALHDEVARGDDCGGPVGGSDNARRRDLSE